MPIFFRIKNVAIAWAVELIGTWWRLFQTSLRRDFGWRWTISRSLVPTVGASGVTIHMTDTLNGDSIISNGLIAAVLRRQDAAVEVHSVERDGTPARMRLRVLTFAGEPAARIERMAIVENTRAGACLEATFTTAQGAQVTSTFRIKRGDVAVQVEPGIGAGKLRVECPGRFAVLPDFFADDIALDATRLPLDRAELPSENFVLHFTGDGDAIAMCVFETRKEDVQVTLNGQGDRRIITGSEVGFEDKKVWVALLDAPGIWHTRDLKVADTGKIIPLDWTMPFPAQWRVDFTRSNDLTDSWDDAPAAEGERQVFQAVVAR